MYKEYGLAFRDKNGNALKEISYGNDLIYRNNSFGSIYQMGMDETICPKGTTLITKWEKTHIQKPVFGRDVVSRHSYYFRSN